MSSGNTNNNTNTSSDIPDSEEQENIYAYDYKGNKGGCANGIIAILIGGALIFTFIGGYIAWLPIFIGVVYIFKYNTKNFFVITILTIAYIILTIIIFGGFVLLFSALGVYDGLGLLVMI